MLRARTGIIMVLSVAALCAVAIPLGVVSVVMMSLAGPRNTCGVLDKVGDIVEDVAALVDWRAPAGGDITIDGLSKNQIRTAQQGWQTANQLGFGDKGATILIATAMQESRLGDDPRAKRPNGDGDVGPLQQRAKIGWYGGQKTMAANSAWLNNPANAAHVFLKGRKLTAQEVAWARKAGTTPAGPAGYTIPGLEQVKGWRELPVTIAAQRVQRSAYPDAYGRHEKLATILVSKFRTAAGTTEGAGGDTSAGQSAEGGQDCTPEADTGAAMDCPASGLAAEKGMTADGRLVMRCIHQNFPQVTALLGIGDRPANVDDDHQTGRAVDAMLTSKAVGEKLAAYAKTNATRLGIKYVIWDAHIWSTQRAKEGWRACGSAAASCYNGANDTLAHRDHVHISVFGNSAQKADPSTATAIKGGFTTPMARGKYHVGARWGATGSWARYHTGQDLGAPIGTTVRAVASGTVEPARGGSWAGTHLVIRHSDGSATLYAHLSITMVRVGDTVKAGQRIGLVGMTGRTFGPHLHFEHYPKGGTIGNPYTTDDPTKWLASNGIGL